MQIKKYLPSAGAIAIAMVLALYFWLGFNYISYHENQWISAVLSVAAPSALLLIALGGLEILEAYDQWRKSDENE